MRFICAKGGVYNTNVYPPGSGYFLPASASPNPPMPVQGLLPNLPIRRKDLLHSPGRVNLHATPSYTANGNDLPSKFYTVIYLCLHIT